MATSETDTIPMTSLEAVNIMLKAIGQAQIMSLTSTDMNEASSSALQALSDAARTIQQQGWHCNTDPEFPITPDQDGNSVVPVNTAGVTVSQRSSGFDLTMRGNKLYDRRKHTYQLGQTVYVDLISYLDFGDLPPHLRWTITTAAAWRWGVGRVPDGTTYKFTESVASEAMAQSKSADQEARNAYGVETNPHFRNMRRR
jgi:hypothetical protein